MTALSGLPHISARFGAGFGRHVTGPLPVLTLDPDQAPLAPATSCYDTTNCLAIGASVIGPRHIRAILGVEDLAPACPASPRNGEDNPFAIADENWRDGLRVGRSNASGVLVMTDGVADF